MSDVVKWLFWCHQTLANSNATSIRNQGSSSVVLASIKNVIFCPWKSLKAPQRKKKSVFFCLLVQLFIPFPDFWTKGKRYSSANAKEAKSSDVGRSSGTTINRLHRTTVQDIATNRICSSYRATTQGYHPTEALYCPWYSRGDTQRWWTPSVQPHQ